MSVSYTHLDVYKRQLLWHLLQQWVNGLYVMYLDIWVFLQKWRVSYGILPGRLPWVEVLQSFPDKTTEIHKFSSLYNRWHTFLAYRLQVWSFIVSSKRLRVLYVWYLSCISFLFHLYMKRSRTRRTLPWYDPVLRSGILHACTGYQFQINLCNAYLFWLNISLIIHVSVWVIWSPW